MGQFKPMVKMMTTEPSVELKLKKGGAVKKAMGGSMIGDQIPAMSTMKGSLGAPRGGMDMAVAPKKPSMAKRKKAMSPKASAKAMSAMPFMKEGGESKSTHKSEMKKMKGLEKELKSHEGKPASKAHKGLKTGGVVMGNAGGYALGGAVKTSKMVTAHPDNSPAVTGGVKLGNAGGFKKGGKIAKYAYGGGVQTSDVVTAKPGVTGTTTGSVTKGNAGGFKHGGKIKGMMDGGMVDGGMMGGGMMGNPMMNNPMSRGYKKGGAPKKFAEGGSVQDDGRPQKMPQGNKPPSKPVSITRLSGSFKKGGGVKKMAGGGSESDYDSMYEREMARKNAEKAANVSENEEMRDMILGAPKRILQGAKRMIGMGSVSDKEPKSITKTEKSVTVTPSKKRGGAIC
jgi:hypothetical protein